MANSRHDIEKYVKGELTPAERNALERRALDDPFLMEALEGAEQISSVELSDDLKQLHLALHDRVNQKGKVIPFWVWPARIAAGLALVAISTFVVMKFMQRETNSDLALKKEEKQLPATPQSQGPVASDSIVSENEVSTVTPEAAVEEPKIASSKPAIVQGIQVTPSESDEQLTMKDDHKTDGFISFKNKSIPAQEPVLAQQDVVLDRDKETSFSYSQPIEKTALPERAEAKTQAAEDVAEALQGRTAGIQAESDEYRSKRAVTERTISGRVTDEQGDGIPGVNVLIKGTDVGTVTDALGNYQIHIDDNKSDLVFSFIGMETLEEPVPQESVLDVSLDQDVSQLSEVVVVGYGVERTEEEKEIPILELAVPAGGRVAYKQYLEQNLRYPEQAIENKIEGRVTVQFTVDTSGKISDFNILKGIGFGCDEEVVRLIKQGPKWNPTRRDTEPVTDKVKVRMRFKLPKNK
ncbi:MAG TPA: TonB family protein [Ohtaekwangia sp.]